MNNISFVLWMVLYPITCAVASYIDAKYREMRGREHFEESVILITSFVNMGIYIWIGIKLYE